MTNLDAVLVGIPDIAEVAGVTRAAVSNWRKRFKDFPEPRLQTDSGQLFDLGSVEEWLLRHGRIDAPVSPGRLRWQIAEVLRRDWPTEVFVDVVSSWLCYLEASERSTRPVGDATAVGAIHIREKDTWAQVKGTDDAKLPERLRSAARNIANANPSLHDLLDGLVPPVEFDTAALRSFVHTLETATQDGTSRADLFDELIGRAVDLGYDLATASTPPALVGLLSDLVQVNSGATVVDPACGTGSLLLGAAARTSTGGGRYVGVDIAKASIVRARSRFFLHRRHGDFELADSLRLARDHWPPADAVITDPPRGLANWGDADTYRNEMWTYGSPPPASADLAWIQLATNILRPGGRAAVVLPAGSVERAGREASIRAELLRSGAIDTIVLLPPRLRRDVSSPLVIWLLRSPHAPGPTTVALVDASNLGTAGRSLVELTEADTALIVETVMQREPRSATETHGIAAQLVTRNDLARGDVNLSPKRHQPIMKAPSLDQTEARASSLESSVNDARQQLAATMDRIPPSPALGVDSSPRKRLGDLVEIHRVHPAGATRPSSMEPLPDDAVLIVDGRQVRAGLQRDPAATTGHRIVLRPRPEASLSTEWLLVWLTTDEFTQLVTRHLRGSTARSLSLNDLGNFEIAVPPLEDQLAASARATAITDAARRTRNLLELLHRHHAAEAKLAYLTLSHRNGATR